MTDIFETRIENLEPKEDKKKFSAAIKKSKDKKVTKKRKQVDFNSSVVESSKESSMEHKSVKNNAFYMENAVILQTNTRIYVQW